MSESKSLPVCRLGLPVFESFEKNSAPLAILIASNIYGQMKQG